MAEKPTCEELQQKIKELEEELAERKGSGKELGIMDQAVASSINAIGITDLQGKLTYVNDACVEMWGYDSKREMLGRYLPEFWEGDGVFDTIRQLQEKGVASGEDIGKRKDGSLFNVEFSANILKDNNTGMSYMFGSFFDITGRKQAEEALKEKETELRIRAKNLEEVNTALRVLLKQREEDKTEVEENVLSNVKDLVLPYLEKLKKTSLDSNQKSCVDILETNLKEIVSPFSRNLSSKYLALTPTEIRVANLIKEGKTTKEIAGFMNVSGKTVETHRDNIRKKTGIKHKKTNLRVYLLSM